MVKYPEAIFYGNLHGQLKTDRTFPTCLITFRVRFQGRTNGSILIVESLASKNDVRRQLNRREEKM